jgi:hypothetical protein
MTYPLSSSSATTAAGNPIPSACSSAKATGWSPAWRSRSSNRCCWESAGVIDRDCRAPAGGFSAPLSIFQATPRSFGERDTHQCRVPSLQEASIGGRCRHVAPGLARKNPNAERGGGVVVLARTDPTTTKRAAPRTRRRRRQVGLRLGLSVGARNPQPHTHTMRAPAVTCHRASRPPSRTSSKPYGSRDVSLTLRHRPCFGRCGESSDQAPADRSRAHASPSRGSRRDHA